MRRYCQYLTGILIMGMLMFGLWRREGMAANTTIKLVVNPNKTYVYLGSGGIALTTRARGKGLTYSWELLGPGKLDGQGSAVFYILPETIEGESDQALITVTVKDETGQEMSESITFNILAPSEQPPAPPSQSTFSLNDLEKASNEKTTEKASWQTTLDEMEAAFSQLQYYEKQDISVNLKLVGWERFLDAFDEDNPYSNRDDELREMAIRRLDSLLEPPSSTPTQPTSAQQPPPEPTNPSIAFQKRSSKTREDPVAGMDFVWIPGGCYQMGCSEPAKYCQDDEKPVHQVCLEGFWMGKYEVTQAQWVQIMSDNPSHFQAEENADNRPVESISWNAIQKFLTKLNEQVGRKAYRLPVEAEWEYACRAGSSTMYGFGDDENELGKYGWYSQNSQRQNAPVGQLAPNAFGLYDMHGNVYGNGVPTPGTRIMKEHPRTDMSGRKVGTSQSASCVAEHGTPGRKMPVVPIATMANDVLLSGEILLGCVWYTREMSSIMPQRREELNGHCSRSQAGAWEREQMACHFSRIMIFLR